MLTSPAVDLCFNQNEFMKENFSVDEFLHQNRNAPASLEELRDNLGLYLKELRSSMIDLINEDYASFVNLSTNLVGLDQSIETIQKPLEKFRNEIQGIKLIIRENEKEIRQHLEQKNQLQIWKRNLQSLKKVYEATNKLENLTWKQLNCDNINPTDIERAALELIQLEFNKKFCEEYLSEEQQNNISRLHEDVFKKLRILFNSTLKTATISSGTEDLEQCLRIYITLNACSIAEEVFKEDIVAPYMSLKISEHSLQNSSQGLAGIYNEVLDFISLHMADLLRITQYTDKLKGFNFLVNSFWSDVEMRLETNLSSIFAPGNSEIFFSKYKCTQDFLGKIEKILSSEETLQTFRFHHQTKSFQSRWNLPVYFQICFQNIAGKYESCLDPILCDRIIFISEGGSEGVSFLLMPHKSAQEAIERCWSDGVYLEEIFPKFFKLTMQIVLRLSRWISDFINIIRCGKDLPIKLTKIKIFIMLHTDTTKFIGSFVKFEKIISESIPKEKIDQALSFLKTTLEELKNLLQKHLVTMEEVLVAILAGESLENMRQVNDLPRLYRKTNREIPNRPSLYVELMLKPIRTFNESYKEHFSESILIDILSKTFSKITTEYYSSVSDVLTSVQKTEESLRRLRHLKEKSNQQITASSMMSDDDKIRLQLQLDAITWAEELTKFNLTPDEVDHLCDLESIVKESLNGKDR